MLVPCTRMAGKLKVAQEKWQKWEEEVEAGLELAQAGVTVPLHLWRQLTGAHTGRRRGVLAECQGRTMASGCWVAVNS